jgi:Cu(I)/Ag(I) efflux system membrane protein CusA/SilA
MKIAHCCAAGMLAVISALAAGQGSPSPVPLAASAAAMPLVQGEVRKVDLDRGLLVLRHGDIPNLAMPAMTMGFDVADRKMLDGLKVGDKVRFQAEMVKGKATVTELRR